MTMLNGLWECLWRTSAAILAIWLITLLLRRQSAALRHALWIGGLVAFILIPALLPLARRTTPIRLAIHVPVAMGNLPVQIAVSAPAPSAKRPTQWPLNRILFIGWLAGAATLCVRRGRAALRMRQIARRSASASRFGSGVRLSGDVCTPLTWGLLRPVILLPRCATEWSAERLRSVLEHEREHIRRFDSLSHWLAELVCAAWWFQPFVWLARNRAAHERECACDDAVLRSGVRPSDYASELLNLASTLPKQGEPIMALSALSNFERRITSLLRPDLDRRPVNIHSRVAVAMATLALMVPLALLRAQAPVGQGDLSGTVVDISGARVVNAQIIASGSSGNREVTRTNEIGQWSLAGVPAGDYTVEVRASGFAVASRALALAPGQKATVDQTMPMGKVQETIEVVAQGQPRRPAVTSSEPAQRIRVGGMVQATKLLKQVKPSYPEVCKAQGIEGTVLMNAIIGTDGNLLSLTVVNKLADPDLAAAALDAARQWRYQPTLLNGEPVEVVSTITVNFKLQ